VDKPDKRKPNLVAEVERTRLAKFTHIFFAGRACTPEEESLCRNIQCATACLASPPRDSLLWIPYAVVCHQSHSKRSKSRLFQSLSPSLPMNSSHHWLARTHDTQAQAWPCALSVKGPLYLGITFCGPAVVEVLAQSRPSMMAGSWMVEESDAATHAGLHAQVPSAITRTSCHPLCTPWRNLSSNKVRDQLRWCWCQLPSLRSRRSLCCEQAAMSCVLVLFSEVWT
jgi:hypothetical protein